MEGRTPSAVAASFEDMSSSIHAYEGGALRRGQGSEGTHHDVARLDGAKLVGGLLPRRAVAQGDSCTATTVPQDVHRGAEQIGGRVIRGTTALPALPHLHESVLCDILGLVAVPRDQPECGAQPVPLLGEHGFKGQGVYGLHLDRRIHGGIHYNMDTLRTDGVYAS